MWVEGCRSLSKISRGKGDVDKSQGGATFNNHGKKKTKLKYYDHHNHIQISSTECTFSSERTPSVVQGAVWFHIHAESSDRVEMKAPCQQPRSFTPTPSETLIQVQPAALRGDAPSAAAPLRGTPAKCSELLHHPTTYVKKSAYYAH